MFLRWRAFRNECAAAFGCAHCAGSAVPECWRRGAVGGMTLDCLRPDPEVYASGCLRVAVWRWRQGALVQDTDMAIAEVPVALRFGAEDAIIMMATPRDIEDFALGFALTEGIVESAAQVLAIEAVPANGGLFVAIELAAGCAQRVQARQRQGPAAGGCGLCGVREIAQALRVPAWLPVGKRFHCQAIFRAMDAMPAWQTIGAQTGTAHGAAFVAADGRILAFAEDAGRHNALDKLVGMVARRGLDPALGFCATTSRASYEMAQKAGSAGFPLLCTLSGTTTLAIDVALACNLTVCSFVRKTGFQCVSAPERLL